MRYYPMSEGSARTCKEGLARLQALAWNRPKLKQRVERVNGEWRAVLTEAFAEPRGALRDRDAASTPSSRS